MPGPRRLWLAILAIAAGAETPTPQSDEKAIATLIDQMGSADFAVREAAGKKLKELGPGMIPALQKYVDYPDPEIASRVKGVISTFDWMNHGAIIIQVDSGSQGEKLGIIPGVRRRKTSMRWRCVRGCAAGRR